MRRALVAGLAVAALVVALTAAGGGTMPGYRVDAIFDNVSFLTDGQDVRVAGAVVGAVEGLEVTPDPKARVRLRVDERFAPFRADADCTIQPQSLIGERFVQCTPGTSAAAPLRPDGEHPPTVPVQNTHAPVDLDLVLATFDRPSRERLGILLGSLGAGLAGRGEDLGAAILRANPALQETRRVLDVLGRDRARLQRLITDGDTVLAALADRRDDVRGFVRDGATVMDTTARRRDRVAETVRRLPPLLREAEPALARLSSFARAGTPLARDLEEAAPDLDALLGRTATFATQLRPTLRRLEPVVRDTRAALPDIAPQLRRLRRFAADAGPAGELVAELLNSVKEKGALDGLGGFFYYTTAAVARFDRFGHYLPAYIIGSSCVLHATTPVPGCSAKYASSEQPAARKRRAKPGRREERPREAAPAPAPQAAPAPARPKVPELPKVPLLEDLPEALEDLREDLPPGVQDLLDGLGLGGADRRPDTSIDRLLDLLLR